MTGSELISKRKDGFEISFDAETSQRMRGIRRKGTKPELIVRQILHGLGHRFRVKNRDLPGSPDIANRKRRWVVFVHGCFWHRHGCKATTTPTRNREFWMAKFERNRERDTERIRTLEADGYRVVVVWECETKHNLEKLAARIVRELPSTP